METSRKTIGVFSIATNLYIDYWVAMAESFDRIMGQEKQVTFYVFTDQVQKAKSATTKFSNNSKVVVFAIEDLGWPDAMILRYRLITDKVSQANEEVLMYLDADMLVESTFDDEFNSTNWKNGIFLAAHPGFYEGYLQRGRRFRSMRKIPSGTWDENKNSSAYVRRQDQKLYVCGAIWGGTRLEFQNMVETLSAQTQKNIDRNVQALWFDESHLNWWASKNKFTHLTPSYCFASGHSENRGIKPIIRMVEKGDHRIR